MNETIVLTAITALIGPAILVVLAWARDQRKIRAESGATSAAADATLVTATLAWASQLQENIKRLDVRVDEMRLEIDKVQRENRSLRRHNVLLTAQVIDMGGKPVPMPADED